MRAGMAGGHHRAHVTTLRQDSLWVERAPARGAGTALPAKRHHQPPLRTAGSSSVASQTRPIKTQPLCPPRPIAFESATSILASRASFGT